MRSPREVTVKITNVTAYHLPGVRYLVLLRIDTDEASTGARFDRPHSGVVTAAASRPPDPRRRRPTDRIPLAQLRQLNSLGSLGFVLPHLRRRHPLWTSGARCSACRSTSLLGGKFHEKLIL